MKTHEMTGYVTAALVTFALAGSARGQDVKTDYEKTANFGAYKTFALKVGTPWGNPLGEKRVVEEIGEALTKKGWTPVAEGQSDTLVVLHGATQQKQNLNTFYSDMGGGWGYRGFGGMGSSTTTVSEYTVGTLVVDIFDTKTKQLVFRGTASDEISNKAEKNVKKVEKASAKMFKNFPPGSAEKK
jgi:hypothetical protein